MVLPDGSVRVVHGTGIILRDADGAPRHGTGLLRDVTELRRWQEKQRLLLHELNHRVKNTLAMVLSIAMQTRRGSQDVEGFVEAFGDRIRTLASAHRLLTRRNWDGAELGHLVAETVATFLPERDDRVRVTGPRFVLKPNATISLAMALHELGTNALKYGAWSTPGGRVDIAWALEPGGRLVLDWTEHDGPPVSPPGHAGFGSRLLRNGIARELGGTVSLDYAREGLRCRIAFAPGAVAGDGPAGPGG
jgi:two-component sensor histidine kinase